MRAIKRISSFLLIAVTETYEYTDIIKLNDRQKMNKTIMIVDDEQSCHDLYEMMLRNTDYEIISVYDGVEALTKLDEKKPDLMIIDIILDMMTGDTLFLYLKSMPRYDDIPVIMASNHSSHYYKSLREIDPDLILLDKRHTTRERLIKEIMAKIG